MLARSLANSIGGKGPVDVVVAWVDGRDRKHRAKRKRYLADPGGDAPERWADWGRRFSARLQPDSSLMRDTTAW